MSLGRYRRPSPLKSDGFPTYHLANVVDDRLMKITHVIRGDEWISSTPKHILLYESFGWTPPVFMHMPLLLGKDGKKLSKRRNPTSIFYYRDSGYLPEAFVNFLTLMGYSMPGDKEIYPLDEIMRSSIPNGSASPEPFSMSETRLDQPAVSDQHDFRRQALGADERLGLQRRSS